MNALNTFDLLLLFLLLLGAVYGSIRGANKQIIGLFSAWLALVIDLWIYKPFSTKILLGQFKTASPVVMDSFSFIILLILLTVLIQLIFIFTNTSPEERRRKKGKKDLNQMLDEADKGNGKTILNGVGGLVVGFFATAIWLSIGLALLQYLLSSINGFGNSIRPDIATSILVPKFNIVLNMLYLSVKYFTPGDLPAIFGAVL